MGSAPGDSTKIKGLQGEAASWKALRRASDTPNAPLQLQKFVLVILQTSWAARLLQVEGWRFKEALAQVARDHLPGSIP